MAFNLYFSCRVFLPTEGMFLAHPIVDANDLSPSKRTHRGLEIYQAKAKGEVRPKEVPANLGKSA